jgi:hypothetical protein
MEHKAVALLLEFLTTDKEQYSNFKLSNNFTNMETVIGLSMFSSAICQYRYKLQHIDVRICTRKHASIEARALFLKVYIIHQALEKLKVMQQR